MNYRIIDASSAAAWILHHLVPRTNRCRGAGSRAAPALGAGIGESVPHGNVRTRPVNAKPSRHPQSPVPTTLGDLDADFEVAEPGPRAAPRDSRSAAKVAE